MWLTRVLLGVVLVACWLPACGGAAHKAAPSVPAAPVPPSDPWAWLPEDSALLAQLVTAPFRETPLWPIWERARRERLALGDLVEPDKLERVLFGGAARGDQTPSFVAALTGTFGPGYLEARAAQRQVQPERHGLLSFYRSGELAFAQVYPELILVCSDDRVEALGARASAGPLAKVREGALFRSLGARINTESADLALIAEDRDGDKKALIQRRAQRYGIALPADQLVRAATSLDMGPSSTALVAVVETTGVAEADALRQSFQDTLSALEGNLLVNLLGLGPLVKALAVNTDAQYVNLRGLLSQADFNSTLERVAGMLDATLSGTTAANP
jgi:hypothetical protein